MLNLHARPDTIAAVVGDGEHLGLRVRYSWEQPLLGSAGGPRRALPLLDSDVIIIVNGDTLCEIDLAPMIARHRDSGAAATLGLIRNPAPDRYNIVQLDGDDRITGVVPNVGPPAEAFGGGGMALRWDPDRERGRLRAAAGRRAG